MALLSLKNVSLSYGGHPLLDDVDLHIERGDRICLLGVNGTGKSSMLNVLSGDIKPDEGQVVFSSGVRVASLPQQVPTNMEGKIIDIVHATDTDGRHQAHEVDMILSRLYLDPELDFATLSGGTRRRVMLAKALLGSPDVVLLDEPTNHLDLDSIASLESYLLRYCQTFLFVTHDRSFLRRLATRIIELDRGRLIDWRCDYDTFLVRKEEALHAESREWERLDEHLEKEEAWRRQGVKARTVRNQGRLSALEALREERSRRRERVGSVQMTIMEAHRTGDKVLSAEKVSFGFGDKPLIRNFSSVLMRGDKVGILGPNGCGKTTLVRLLLDSGAAAGCLAPESGLVKHGTNLKIAYSDQLRAQLDEEASLAENIAQGKEFVMINGGQRHIVGYLQDFLFAPERVRQPVKSLSGGERNRLLLARLFAEPSNVLVLDEPTNDLDLDTLELLEERIAAYNGTVLMISHDRTFLNNSVRMVWAFEKHSPEPPYTWLGADEGWYINEYVGGYDDWEERRILPPEPVVVKSSQPKERPAAKRKLSYKESRELGALPAQIEAMEAEQTQWHVRLGDPEFYRKGGDEVAKASKRAEELTLGLEKAYLRWAELDSRRL
ncbi:MAG: ABC transporter ATP-binding protein [Lentisphaerae bacterium RIFOXYA12_FULL_48_11]|nr:MAG: ABC transporter ATP-binding protein [Lentisphaerae bacterium RIFOXYA12_FULL_48_11]